MAVQYPFVGGNVIESVVVRDRWGHAGVVQLQNTLGDKFAVEAITDEIDTQCSGYQPNCANCFASIERDRTQRKGAEYRDEEPTEIRQ